MRMMDGARERVESAYDAVRDRVEGYRTVAGEMREMADRARYPRTETDEMLHDAVAGSASYTGAAALALDGAVTAGLTFNEIGAALGGGGPEEVGLAAVGAAGVAAKGYGSQALYRLGREFWRDAEPADDLDAEIAAVTEGGSLRARGAGAELAGIGGAATYFLHEVTTAAPPASDTLGLFLTGLGYPLIIGGYAERKRGEIVRKRADAEER